MTSSQFGSLASLLLVLCFRDLPSLSLLCTVANIPARHSIAPLWVDSGGNDNTSNARGTLPVRVRPIWRPGLYQAQFIRHNLNRVKPIC